MQGLRRLYRRWHWPAGWWRLRGHATLELGGVPIRFAEIAGSEEEWWAKRSRKRDWEAPVIDSFAKAVPRGGVVYDVGAWIGPYTLVASSLVGPEGSVFAFEPDPVARARLERNIALNEAHNVKVVPLALTREAGSAKLAGGLSEATVGTVGDVEVETISLPGFIARTGAAPDLIKVDIEGGEADLDPSALRDIAAVFIEVHAPEFKRRGIDPETFLEEIAGERGITRLEGNADNYNVCIVS